LPSGPVGSTKLAMEASALKAPVRIARPAQRGLMLRVRSDEQLVALFRAGNDDAFRVIHDRYRQRLFAYVRRMLPYGPRSDAEDALQDVFLSAYRSLRADERPVALRAWLYRVAHNRCIDELRRPAPIPAELPDVAASDLHDPIEQSGRREDLERLVRDLERLPEQQRSALLLRELEGLTYTEIAVTLGVSLPAVKSLLVRARMGLAEAREARDCDCEEIRVDLARTCERGVRTSARARRHLRDCKPCTTYRTALRGTSRDLAALAPAAGPIAGLAQLLGIGGSGAAAGGGAIGSGAASGGSVMAGGGIAAAVSTKVAVVVCCVAVTAGGAAQIERAVDPAPAPPVAPARAPALSPSFGLLRTSAPVDPRTEPAAPAARKPAPATATTPAAPVTPAVAVAPDPVDPTAVVADPSTTGGGAVAPDEPVDPSAPVTDVSGPGPGSATTTPATTTATSAPATSTPATGDTVHAPQAPAAGAAAPAVQAVAGTTSP